MNPVRAGIVKHPGEYRCSSYHANGYGKKNILINQHPIYTALSNDKSERHYAYRELFNSELDENKIHDIRNALNQEFVLGREDFKDKIEVMTNRQTR